MTLKNGFGKCSLFGLSAQWMKRSKHDLFVFPPKKIKSCCSMTSKRSIGWFLEILGHEVLSLISSVRLKNQSKATQVCIRSINQSNRSISVHLFFLCCSRVFFSRSYENRSSRSFFLMLVPKRNSIRPRANVWMFFRANVFNLCNRFTRKRANSVTELLTQVRTNIFKCQHWIFSLFTKARNWLQDCIVQTVQKTYLVQLLTRVRVKVPPYRWTLTYFLSGQKLAEFVVQIFAWLRGSRKNERRTHASFCPFKKVS